MGKNRLSRIAADRVVGASLVVIFLLIVVLFGLKCLEVWFESSASEQSLSILGRALQRRFDDLLLWSYFIVLCLGSSVFAALRMPDVKPVRPIGRQLGLLWICLTLCQFFTYFWSQGNPFDPGTFFWTGEAIQVHRDAIANIQWAEGVVDLVLIAAMQTVIVMSLRVCGMTRDTKLSDKARLGLNSLSRSCRPPLRGAIH